MLANPLEVHVGAASASGANAIATALAPAASSGATKVRILMMALLLCGAYWQLPESSIRNAMSSMLAPNLRYP